MEHQHEEAQLTLVLRISNINHILAGLREIKYKDADPIIREITRQAQLQLTVAEPKEEGETVEEAAERIKNAAEEVEKTAEEQKTEVAQ